MIPIVFNWVISNNKINFITTQKTFLHHSSTIFHVNSIYATIMHCVQQTYAVLGYVLSHAESVNCWPH